MNNNVVHDSGASSEGGEPRKWPIALLAWHSLLGRKTILFLSRFPVQEDLKDGYFQRVKAIDHQLADHDRIYLNLTESEARWLPRVLRVKEGVLEIRACARQRWHRVLLSWLSRLVGRTYAHSILRLDSELPRRLFSRSRKRILDVHGVVPEEFAFHGDQVGSRVFDEIEAAAMQKATAVVCVTNRMAEHLGRKHALDGGKAVIVLPIILAPPAESDPGKEFAGPSIIYCGGLHKWQQVEKMLAFVYQNQEKASFTFLVPEPEKLCNLYRQQFGEPFPGTVRAAAADEVRKCYGRCSFGLVLREDVVVNHVACPTKLIEYLQNDVVPIVDSPNIGDFPRFQYAYIGYQDDLPAANQWREMVARNRVVVRQLYQLFAAGTQALRLHL